jgi:hypothetical protein
MSARHRLSKLLLRQGIVYSGGKPWTGSHDLWLGAQRRSAVFTLPGWGLAFDIAYDTLLATVARRDRLDAAITELAAASEFTPVVTRLGCLRGVSTLTEFGLGLGLSRSRSGTGTASMAARSAPTSAWCPPNPPREAPGHKVRSPRPATGTPAGC